MRAMMWTQKTPRARAAAAGTPGNITGKYLFWGWLAAPFPALWCKITSDPVIFRYCWTLSPCYWRCYYTVIFEWFAIQVQHSNEIIAGEINKLLQLKVIKVAHKPTQQVMSPIFLRDKKNEEFHMVLNLQRLSNYLPYKHFKMENFEQAISLINKDDFLASVDLRQF